MSDARPSSRGSSGPGSAARRRRGRPEPDARKRGGLPPDEMGSRQAASRGLVRSACDHTPAERAFGDPSCGQFTSSSRVLPRHLAPGGLSLRVSFEGRKRQGAPTPSRRPARVVAAKRNAQDPLSAPRMSKLHPGRSRGAARTTPSATVTRVPAPQGARGRGGSSGTQLPGEAGVGECGRVRVGCQWLCSALFSS